MIRRRVATGQRQNLKPETWRLRLASQRNPPNFREVAQSLLYENKFMKLIITAMAILCSVSSHPVRADVYIPTVQAGEFLRQFEKAYHAGDQEWIRSAVDKDGIVEEARALFYGFLGPVAGGESISDLKIMAAPTDYKLPNSVTDTELESTIPVDFLLVFTRKTGEFDTTIKVPVGYRDGTIWLVGIKRK